MRPFFSLVIPYYDSLETITPLLESIYASKNAPHFEVVIVDDGSRYPMTRTLAKSVRKPRGRGREVRIVRLKRNMGPAAARNRGAKEARGKFVVFLDSDVEVFPDTLANLFAIFKDDPDVVAVTGVWAKEQKTGAFFPNFKALRDWSYWINERDKSGYYYLFSTRIASIKRSVFLRLGGFDERYPGALVEDIELTYRIARRYAIIFAQNVRVRHEFEGFWPIAKKYFLRAFYWTKLYAQRKKFDPVATTIWEALAAVTGAGTLFVSFFWVISLLIILLGIFNFQFSIFNIISRSPLFVLLNSLFLLMFATHLFLVRKFLVFMYQEKDLAFAVKGFFTGLVLYCFILAGALWGRLRK